MFSPAQAALFAYWQHHVWWSAAQWERWLLKTYGVKTIRRLTEAQATDALTQLQARQGGAVATERAEVTPSMVKSAEPIVAPR